MTELPYIEIKGKKYVLVKDRILYFNETYPNGSITTERLSEWDREIFRATVTPDLEKPERFFIGYAQAQRGAGFINQSSALENAETSAVGRALAFMGIGVIDWVASVDEINKAESATQSESTYSKKPEASKPRFNDPEFQELSKKTEFIKSFEFADLLLDEIRKDYKVSSAKSTEIFNLYEETVKDDRETANELPF